MNPLLSNGSRRMRVWLLAALALGLATPLWAQTPSNGTPPASPVVVAAQAGSTSRAVLYDNGPYITQTGVGYNGADVSEVETGTLEGYLCQQDITRIADDFRLPACNPTLDELKWLAFQIGASTAGTMTGISISIYDESPSNGGSSIAGDDTTNRFKSQVWTGVYRVDPPALGDFSRAIIEITGDLSFVGNLPPEDYWLSVACTGLLLLGPPLANPTVPSSMGDNGEQYLGGGPVAAVAGRCRLPVPDPGKLGQRTHRVLHLQDELRRLRPHDRCAGVYGQHPRRQWQLRPDL